MSKTLILPGFSLKNKDWAESIQKELSGNFDCEVVYWSHWEGDNKWTEGWIEKEAQKIVENNSEPIDIIAKSIGTAVTAFVIKKKPELIKKLILCGIPLNDLDPGEETLYDSLKVLTSNNILCIQNEKDPHGSFDQVKKILFTINPTIKIVKKGRDDHEYPYSQDFIQFLQE